MAGEMKEIRILLVEDSAIMRKMEVKTLKSLEYKNIVEAEDGHKAIAKLQESEEKFDLIISDWNMPGKDGYELLLWVRADEKNKNIPFLMATGQGDKQQAKKALDAGVSSFISKPFNADELQGKIEEAFGMTSAEEEVAAEDLAPRKTASGKVMVRIAHIQITDHLILGVLKDLINKGELNPKYFELETQCLPGWNPVEKALEKGTVDAAFILAPIAMDLFNYGLPIKMILLAHKNGSISVRGKHGEYVEPLSDFYKGKSFYIPHKMSVHHMLAHLFFSKIGLASKMGGDATEVNFEVVAPIKMPEFLRDNPASCGFMVAEPLGTKTISSGVGEMLFLSSELWAYHPCCVVAMRDNFIDEYRDAVYELTEMLVHAGKFIEQKPEIAAEIAVRFLDPNKQLGLKVPILKNVLKEAKGIKTGDLFPVVEDFEKMQQYMFHQMGIGALIDMDKFVDTRFAEAACTDGTSKSRHSIFHDTPAVALELLERGKATEAVGQKAMLGMEGKYLSFVLGQQEFGIDILKIREIIGLLPIRPIPKAPECVKGVINLRERVIPVIDLRADFGMEISEYSGRNSIIILELDVNGKTMPMGIVVESVSEVMDIKASDIDSTPALCDGFGSSHILGMARIENKVKILLDIEQALDFSTVNLNVA